MAFSNSLVILEKVENWLTDNYLCYYKIIEYPN